MHQGWLSWLIFLIVAIVVAWVALSILLVWAKPMLYNDDGSVNWWTTLWVAAVQLIFAWVIWVVIAWLFRWIRGSDLAMDPLMPGQACSSPIPKRY